MYRDAPISKVLDICFQGLPLSYRILDKVVLVEMAMTYHANDTTPAPARPVNIIHGGVVNETGEPLVGATVKLKGTTTTVVTDGAGNFQLNTADLVNPALEISFVGYTQALHR